MSEKQKPPGLLQRIFRGLYFRFWSRRNATEGNVHLGADSAHLKKIPFTKDRAFLRPSTSDVGRVGEYTAGIYYSKNYLHAALLDAQPSVLIDIGANIGLSSLSLVKEFRSIKNVVAIEAEEENYDVLRKNFALWAEEYPDVAFHAVHGVATSTATDAVVSTDSLASLTGENSASGTFRFDVAAPAVGDHGQKTLKAIAINELFEEIAADERVVVKVDIEGGEEHLLSANTEWVALSTFLTMEVHDRFHPVMLNSSKNVIRVLFENDFAIVPSEDILHCYNREKLFPVADNT